MNFKTTKDIMNTRYFITSDTYGSQQIFTRDPNYSPYNAKTYFEWIKKDRLSIRIHEKIPLKDARKAHEDLESRKTSGR